MPNPLEVHELRICSAGSAIGSLLYGLRVRFYSLPWCSRHNGAGSFGKRLLPDFSSLHSDLRNPPRCQNALDYKASSAEGSREGIEFDKRLSLKYDTMALQAFNSSWDTLPPLRLPPATGCFGAKLDGYIRIQPNGSAASEGGQPSSIFRHDI